MSRAIPNSISLDSVLELGSSASNASRASVWKSVTFFSRSCDKRKAKMFNINYLNKTFHVRTVYNTSGYKVYDLFHWPTTRVAGHPKFIPVGPVTGNHSLNNDKWSAMGWRFLERGSYWWMHYICFVLCYAHDTHNANSQRF